MSQPPAYDRAFSFTDWTANHPASQQPGVSLDNEFEAIEVTTDAIRANLALIQRDDGQLANGVVGPDSVSLELTFGLRSVRTWAAATAFVINDAAWVGAKLYRCLVAHTSAASFATDLTAAKWTLITDLQAAADIAINTAALGTIVVDTTALSVLLAAKASLATNNTFAGAQLFNALPTITIGSATTLSTYLSAKPSDYGAGKPAFLLRKSAASTKWSVVLDDGAGGGGTVDFDANSLTVAGAVVPTAAQIVTLTANLRRARTLAICL